MPKARLPLVDLLRGCALWAMFAFHLTWDLANFGWINPDTPFAPGFRWFGHVIASSFLLLVGVSLVLARQSRGPLWRSRSFWRRWGLIVAAAAAISAVSYWLFPATPIFFGILHCIALASLLALPLLDAPPALTLGLAVLSLLAPHFFASTVFDGKIFWWTGLSSFKPPSNDYQPLLPALAFVFFGLALGRWAEKSDRLQRLAEFHPENTLARAINFCGRNSLAFYLVHQPILFGVFTALSLVVMPPPDARLFLRQCAVQCVNEGVEAGVCEKSCACVIERAQKQGFWLELARDRMTPQQKTQAHDEAVACYTQSLGN